MRLWVLATVLAVSFSQLVYAATRAASFDALVRTGYPSDNFKSQKSRDELVEAAGNYCADIEKAMPRNSPAEERWLDAEIKGDWPRVERALISPEWRRRASATFVDDCKAFVSIYRMPGQETRALVGLALTYSRFGQEAVEAFKVNKVNADSLLPAIIKWQVDRFLYASLASMP